MRNCVGQAAAPSPTIPLPPLGRGILIWTIVVFVWVGTLAHPVDQSAEMSSSTSMMIGKPVKNLEGKDLGKIKDLAINWRSGGYIEYAVLSFGGFFGVGEEYVAVPWVALTPGNNKDYLVLNVKEEHLKDAFESVVYRFYDRSSAAVFRSGRSTPALLSNVPHATKGDNARSDWNVSAARPLGTQYAVEAEFQR